MEMQFYKLLSIILFSSGIYLLINTEVNITGAVIGISYTTNSIIGTILILISGILFMAGESLEQRIKLTSTIKKDRGILRLAKEAVKNKDIKKDLNHLICGLSRGNLNAGLKPAGHISETNIFYLRAKHGGRLYFHKTTEGYEIVGKSAKGKNQDKVIKRLKEIYS